LLGTFIKWAGIVAIDCCLLGKMTQKPQNENGKGFLKDSVDRG
jgi:hypothetical protein